MLKAPTHLLERVCWVLSVMRVGNEAAWPQRQGPKHKHPGVHSHVAPELTWKTESICSWMPAVLAPRELRVREVSGFRVSVGT